MGILYKHYFGRLRLLRSSDVDEDPGPKTSRRLCRVVYVNIRGLPHISFRRDVYVRDGFSAYRQRGNECGCCVVIVVTICSSGHNFYGFGLYRNSDLSDKIFDCLLTAMTKVQFMDRKVSFLFIGDVNHEE